LTTNELLLIKENIADSNDCLFDKPTGEYTCTGRDILKIINENIDVRMLLTGEYIIHNIDYTLERLNRQYERDNKK